MINSATNPRATEDHGGLLNANDRVRSAAQDTDWAVTIRTEKVGDLAGILAVWFQVVRKSVTVTP